MNKIRFDDAINCSPFDFNQRVGYVQSQITFPNEIWLKIIAVTSKGNGKRYISNLWQNMGNIYA